MTRTEAKNLLPIIQAYANGETIQIMTMTGEWRDAACEPSFSEPASSYKIKPKPREFWLCAPNVCGTIPYAVWSIDPGTPNDYAEVIHVKEVI